MSWLRSTITSMDNAVTTPVAATRDALAEKLQSVRDAASLLYEISGNCTYRAHFPNPKVIPKKILAF